MIDVIVSMTDGTKREFRHKGRAGGSYSKRVRYEPGFVVIVDEWSNETAIPERLIQEVQIKRFR
jgi:hypothetical protein